VTYKLHHGDCIDIMASLPAESVDAIVTSPPYAEQRKSTYGGIPEKDYPAWTVAWMAEAKRILKPDGSAIINIRPHIKNGQISDYTLRTRLALRDAGWNECEELIWHKPSSPPLGSPQRPRRSWESLHWFAKHGKPYVDAKAAGKPIKFPGDKSGGQSGPHISQLNGLRQAPGIARVTDAVTVATDQTIRAHPAPYPWQLAEWCGKLICPQGGTILDPFSGSASTGVAAIRNGWHYIGIDAIAEYVDMSRKRLDAEQTKQAPTEGPFSCTETGANK
jgi:DNA modification methylase